MTDNTPSGATTIGDAPFTHGVTERDDFTLHHVSGGGGEPLVLLHGGFQTWRCWRRLMPALAEDFRVVAVDLRGLGDSGAPAGPYDQRTLGGDVAAVLDSLGIERANVVGHDLGAAVATAFAVDFPQRALRLGFLEYLLCGFGFEEALAPRPDNHHLWFAALNMIPQVPEMLVAGHERAYLTYLLRDALSANPDAVAQVDLDEYVRCYAAEDGWRPLCEMFRATWDNADQNRANVATRLTMPALALGGEFSAGAYVAQSLSALADDVSGGTIAGAGHWLPEEKPDELLAELRAFLRRPLAS